MLVHCWSLRPREISDLLREMIYLQATANGTLRISLHYLFVSIAVARSPFPARSRSLFLVLLISRNTYKSLAYISNHNQARHLSEASFLSTMGAPRKLTSIASFTRSNVRFRCFLSSLFDPSSFPTKQKFLRNEHSWSHGIVNLFFIVGNTPGITPLSHSS